MTNFSMAAECCFFLRFLAVAERSSRARVHTCFRDHPTLRYGLRPP